MPIYDFIYGTTDNLTESLYERSLEIEEESPDVIHLTHLTTHNSIYQMRLGFPSLSSCPLWSRPPWYLTCFMWPFTLLCSFALTSAIPLRTFVFERNRLRDLTVHSHLLPKFSFHVSILHACICTFPLSRSLDTNGFTYYVVLHTTIFQTFTHKKNIDSHLTCTYYVGRT